MKTFIICRQPRTLKLKNKPTKTDTPDYVVYDKNKVIKDYVTGSWTKHKLHMHAPYWESITDESLHLSPGGGPIRVKLVMAKNQDGIKRLRIRKG